MPMTIEAENPKELETVTHHLQDHPQVRFVDVVYVHYEDVSEQING
ncbi:hypothetical protein [Polystyrenella longa]|nr:hypothetical protein [Polystyrenella longa]